LLIFQLNRTRILGDPFKCLIVVPQEYTPAFNVIRTLLEGDDVSDSIYFNTIKMLAFTVNWNILDVSYLINIIRFPIIAITMRGVTVYQIGEEYDYIYGYLVTDEPVINKIFLKKKNLSLMLSMILLIV